MTVLDRVKSLLGLDPDQAAELERLPADGPSRRGFLRALVGAGAVAATCDAEQLLWTPEKVIIVPPAPPVALNRFLTLDEYVTEAMRVLARQIDASAAEWAMVNHQSFKIGDTITVRKPQRFIVSGQGFAPSTFA